MPKKAYLAEDVSSEELKDIAFFSLPRYKSYGF
jgi:hypothetical protein